jgi:hypothetical protein
MLLTRKNLLLFGQRGVVNPARIGAAATGRLAAFNREPRARGGGDGGAGGAGKGANGRYGADLEAKKDHHDVPERGDTEKKGGLFHLRHVVGVMRQHKEKQHTEVGSSDDTSAQGGSRGADDPHGGDTSFAAGRFTTQAFETERSFELGSDRPPFTPNSPLSPTSPMSTRQDRESAFQRAQENGEGGGVGAAPGGLAPVGEASASGNGGSGINTPAEIESYSLGTPYDQLAAEPPIPEGMSQHLGGGDGEYDLDRDREWRKSFGAAGDASRHLRVEEDAPGAGSSSNRSNFLDFKDSKSGASAEGSSPSHPYPPLSVPEVQPPQHHHHTHPSSHSYSHSHPPTHVHGDSERARKGSATSRPGSAKSRGDSSVHAQSMGGEGQKRIDVSDYSIPMKVSADS